MGAKKRMGLKSLEEKLLGVVAALCKVLLQGGIPRGYRLMRDAEESPAMKGYVPMLVGMEAERVLVPVELLGSVGVQQLLEEAAREFGYGAVGVLRIPCEVEHFRRITCSIVEIL